MLEEQLRATGGVLGLWLQLCQSCGERAVRRVQGSGCEQRNGSQVGVAGGGAEHSAGFTTASGLISQLQGLCWDLYVQTGGTTEVGCTPPQSFSSSALPCPLALTTWHSEQSPPRLVRTGQLFQANLELCWGSWYCPPWHWVWGLWLLEALV